MNKISTTEVEQSAASVWPLFIEQLRLIEPSLGNVDTLVDELGLDKFQPLDCTEKTSIFIYSLYKSEYIQQF